MAPPRAVAVAIAALAAATLLPLLILVTASPLVSSFAPPLPSSTASRRNPYTSPLSAKADGRDRDVDSDEQRPGATGIGGVKNRRAFLSASAAGGVAALSGAVALPSAFAEDAAIVDAAVVEDPASSAFESIAARAASISKDVAESEQKIARNADVEVADAKLQAAKQRLDEDTRTLYDFTLPVAGVERPVVDLIGQGTVNRGGGATDTDETQKSQGSNVKAILVVNMKQDDPIARNNIPELLALITKYGKNGEFAVILSPTDQGYYEPDTSALLRLKLAAEYNYGANPAAILTDKVNILGTGAVPFWRWLEGSCRTPAGLGKVQANFEKFLVDGQTGKPLRRYPRKYQPYDISDDIAAVIAGGRLPPAGANFREEWRNAAKEAEADTYRFQKGLNYFDQ